MNAMNGQARAAVEEVRKTNGEFPRENAERCRKRTNCRCEERKRSKRFHV